MNERRNKTRSYSTERRRPKWISAVANAHLNDENQKNERGNNNRPQKRGDNERKEWRQTQ